MDVCLVDTPLYLATTDKDLQLIDKFCHRWIRGHDIGELGGELGTLPYFLLGTHAPVLDVTHP